VTCAPFFEQPLDESLRRVGLARDGGADDDRDPVIERVGGKSGWQNITGRFGRGGMRPALADSKQPHVLV